MDPQVKAFIYKALKNIHKEDMDHEMLMYNVVVAVATAKVAERARYPGDNP